MPINPNTGRPYGKNTQLGADLRVCASCRWIYHQKDRHSNPDLGCPKCGFASYGARFVFGDKAYQYAKTQKPWFDDKMAAYASKLYDEISLSMPKE